MALIAVPDNRLVMSELHLSKNVTIEVRVLIHLFPFSILGGVGHCFAWHVWVLFSLERIHKNCYYGTGHLVTATLEQADQIWNKMFNFAWNLYSSSQNALFDERKRSAKQIFIIPKIKWVILFDLARLVNRHQIHMPCYQNGSTPTPINPL
jgi:hypothetical protein